MGLIVHKDEISTTPKTHISLIRSTVQHIVHPHNHPKGIVFQYATDTLRQDYVTYKNSTPKVIVIRILDITELISHFIVSCWTRRSCILICVLKTVDEPTSEVLSIALLICSSLESAKVILLPCLLLRAETI